MMIFTGDVDEEIFEECNASEWLLYINLFFDLIHAKYGHFIRLPFNGCLMDQPARTHSILVIIRKVYLEYLEKLNKK